MITTNKYNLIILLLITLSLGGCAMGKLQPHHQEMIKKKETFYTQVNMWTEKGHIIATNYIKGSLIPANSPVTINKLNSSVISFDYEGISLNLINVEKYTKIDVAKLFERTFSIKKINLSQFNKKEKNAILNGEVTTGMSKDAVIISRGYPPAHYTPSVKLDSWRYWDSKFNTTIYKFNSGKVSKKIK